MRQILFPFILLIAVAEGATAAPPTPGPCSGFKWDISREHALFGGQSTALLAAKDTASARPIVPDQLYEIRLQPQSQVAFAQAPGKKMSDEGTYAGLLALSLDTPGNYRVSVDLPLWIDIAADGHLAATRDFQGQRSCDAPHKIVEFDLSGARHFMLQMSGSAKATVRLTVTKASD